MIYRSKFKLHLKCISATPFYFQTNMKGRLKGAQKGHSLLKKKADALQMRFRQILKKIVETKQTMGDVMKEAGNCRRI